MSEEGITVLTGAAQAAARGELHGEMHLNVAARDAALGVIQEVDLEALFPPLPTIEPEAAMPPIAWNNNGILTAGPILPEFAPEPDPKPPAHDSPIDG